MSASSQNKEMQENMATSPGPYIDALQSLPGKSAPEKLQELHNIASTVALAGNNCNNEERENLLKNGRSDRVKEALIPLLKAIVADKAKSVDGVVEALKSDDISVVKQAVKAKWFFNGSDDSCDVDFFKNQVIPCVSLRSRREIVKALARGLTRTPEKADEFFAYFVDSFGVDQSLPLLTACSEGFVFDEILKRKILLPIRILTLLYRKYPDLAIRYLRLAFEEESDREEDDRSSSSSSKDRTFKIEISRYVKFLPLLVKRHSRAFVELNERLANCCSTTKPKLGSTRINLFLKTATQSLIDNPSIFLKILPWKRVYHRLSKRQLELMFRNTFPKDEKDFDLYDAVESSKKFDLPIAAKDQLEFWKRTYESVYGVEIDIYQHIRENDKFYKLLTKEEKIEFARRRMQEKLIEAGEESLGELSDDCENILKLLPPERSIPILKKKMNYRASKYPRSFWINQMIESCSYYDDEGQFLKVLKYYNRRHKNEQPSVVAEVVSCLAKNAADYNESNGEISKIKLNEDGWKEVCAIVRNAYVTDELFGTPKYQLLIGLAWTFCFHRDQLRTELAAQAAAADSCNDDWLNELVLYLLEGYVQHDWAIRLPENQWLAHRSLLDRLLTLIPQKYDHEHELWKSYSSRSGVVKKLIEDIFTTNKSIARLGCKEPLPYVGTLKRPFGVDDYDRLEYSLGQTFVERIEKRVKIKSSTTIHDLKEWMDELFDYSTYRSKEEPRKRGVKRPKEANMGNNPKKFLKINRDEIASKWSRYLDECRSSLVDNSPRKAVVAKRFLQLTKWYQDVPRNFVEKSLREIEKKGSVLVLSVLLDGASLTRIIIDHLPKLIKIVDDSSPCSAEKEKEVYDLTSSLLRSAGFANPPISLDLLSPYCHGKFIHVADNILDCLAQRVPKPRISSFADELSAKPAMSTLNIGIRLKNRVATRQESSEFLGRAWKNTDHASVREYLARIIRVLFREQPTADTWEAMKTCIDGMTADERNILQPLTRVDLVSDAFFKVYVEGFIKKLDLIFAADRALDYNMRIRKEYILIIFSRIDKRQLQLLNDDFTIVYVEELLFDLQDDDFFIDKYLNVTEGDRFESRIKALGKVLKAKINAAYRNIGSADENDCTREKVSNFLRNLSDTFKRKDKRICRRLCEELLKTLTDNLKLWEDPESFMRLKISKGFLEARDFGDFGSRCAEVIEEFASNFDGGIFLQDFAEIIHDAIENDDSNNPDFVCGKIEYLVIDALMNKNERLGSLVGIYILKNCDKTRSNKKDFETFVERCKKIENPTVNAALNRTLM